MQDKGNEDLLRVPRNKGILGQEIFFIKHREYLWSLRNKDGKLWGRVSWDLGETWQDWRVLLTEYDGYFSFTVNGTASLHLICKKTSGELAYILWQGEEVKVNLLKEGYLDEEQITYQTILIDDENRVYLIFFTENPQEKTWKIKFCIKDTNGWSKAHILDGGVGYSLSQGAAALDVDNTLYLIYQIHTDGKYQFVLREKSPLNYLWSDKKVITASQRSNLNPCLVIDGKGTLHLTWIRSDGMNYRVIYRQKTRGGWMVGGWQQDRELSLPGNNCYSPAIGIIDNQVIVLWQQVEGIYQAISHDEGKTFNPPQLQEKYQKLLYGNLIILDAYKKQGLNTMATFDTGSTSVALLATVFHNREETESYLNLPEVKEGQEANYLTLDFGQKGLETHLRKINDNLQKILFESEDVRLTNLQMKETIEEKVKTIKELEGELALKTQDLSKLIDKNKVQEQMIEKLKGSIVKGNKENEEKSQQLKKEIKALKEEGQRLKAENTRLSQSIDKLKAINEDMGSKNSLQEEIIRQLEAKLSRLKGELEEIKSQPFWRKFF